MLNFGVGLLVSVIVTLIVLGTNRYHRCFTHDDKFDGIQRYHTNPTPRIGGVVIFLGLVLVVLYNYFLNLSVDYDLNIIFSALLVFIIGVLEDITKSITPLIRLIAFVISTVIAIYVVRAMPVISYADSNFLEQLIINYPIIGFLLSLFCVVGLTNAYNIIDGYNGLSSTTAMINLLGLAILASYVNDIAVFRISIVLCATILGFWLFNYPWGKIFLGDGGAYTLGFIIAVMSIYLIHVHRGLISPYAVLLLAIYPVTEMGFSIFRRKFIHRTRGMHPDNMHFHQLIYHQCVPDNARNRNACVMPLMLIFMIPPAILAVLFYKDTAISLLSLVLYILVYIVVYFRLARFSALRALG
ncbi:MAG: undecaprenyl/decaprenyl-phosphate alpha-N-acetylglucosaminyl 1-phosphate transferase [Burkholderiales bacterium]|nr:undecaprenyl/decaprenyl-phosphate alpha-N-acetylglucosaminyl 1-phosphate transferase [Burkholderiales bacterium]